MPPLFYLIFGAFGLVYALYYLVLIIGDTLHPHLVHGKAQSPGVGLIIVVVVFLALSLGNIYLGIRVWRSQRAARS